ncbi:MAG: thioredoxin family protein [Pseudomonadota bacterium]
MRAFVAILFTILLPVLPTSAEPVVKIINFTADWCPNCQILNPRLDEAMEAFDRGSVERIDLDVTRIRRNTSIAERGQIQAEMLQLAAEHDVAYLIDWYGGVTGIAVAVSADTGEALTCFMRPMTAKAIEKQLNLAKILAENGRPGQRKPNGPDCPVLR